MSLKIVRPFFIFTLILIVKFLTGYCDLSVMNDQIAIIFTGEENGYLKPCGCAEGQLGGIKRRYESLESLKSDEPVILPISLGDIPANPDRQNEIKMEITLRAMDMMGYVVHNLGEKDIAMGYETLRYFSQISHLPFISSNVRFSDVSDAEIEPYLKKKIKTKKSEIKIAFLGILSPDLADNGSYNIKILDPVESLKPLVKRLRKDADLLILLSHAEEDETLQIASEFPEFDLVITGHGIDDPDASPKKVNDTLIVSAGKSGKYLGVVKYLKEEDTWKTLSGKEDDFVKIIPLGQEFNRPSKVDILLNEYKSIVKEEDLLGKYQKILSNQGDEYTGSLMCGSCHINIYLHWKETRHFMAYDTLKKDGDQFDPECIKCHVVGFDYSAGFISIDKTPDLKGVGCESCHGFGGIHVMDTAIPYKNVYERECVKCHDPENSPYFEYPSYWKKIKHPPDKINKDSE